MRNGGFCYEVLLAVFIIPKRGVGGDAQHTQSMHSHSWGHIGRVHMKVAPSYAAAGPWPGARAWARGSPGRPRQQSGRQALRNQVLPSDAQHAALARADRRAPKNAHAHQDQPVKRHRGSRDTHGTHGQAWASRVPGHTHRTDGRTRAHGSHRRTSQPSKPNVTPARPRDGRNRGQLNR